MKTEREFIAGVYEKYEREKEIRRRRIRMLSMSATLSACACIALVVSIRTLPQLMNSEVKTADRDASYDYVVASDEKAYDMAIRYYAADQAIDDAEITYEKNAEENGLATELMPAPEAQSSVKLTKGEKASPKEKTATGTVNYAVLDTETEEECFYITTEGALGIGYTADAQNGAFEYTLPADVNSESISVSVAAESDFVKLSEESSQSGAVYGETDNGYYVYFSAGDDTIVILLEKGTVSAEQLAEIAASLSYTE